ncbi:3-oxoacyl-ACP reductase FabG [Gloeobacter kilaueensis]|uniref:3-ketoacyl-(Acyl-carrier-protein) reductase n=1 Tax=Gloeobacter kilaueensis (strain ATCC BAA-2537 / CCAP 1431/1 / ULC 316 / JS1) TaxID=1183438 RepID=U5QGH3_GLOK1|nr:3-oxoacyl-ACP reductase FabG [Gloeobacter kilaueensis]AGY56765.1 3-ketoacyl-(acyl-carrier-protein) reductase [Gloeobacter kilaueensis JS1]
MQGKQVLLTGGTGGLGLGVALAVLERGGWLTIPYIEQREVERFKSHLSPAQWTRVRLVEANLTDEGSVENLVASMERVDVLIHLVGGFSMGPTAQYSYADWQHNFELNLSTTFLVSKHCLARMLPQNYGRIVTVGSRGAVEPAAQLAAYSAAKAGVVAFTRAIAAETKGTGITANTVLPSIIDTPANRAAMGEQNASKWVTPASLAEVICFLASEAAADVSGAAVPVYGGS